MNDEQIRGYTQNSPIYCPNQTERESYKLKSEELEGALETSKGREEATLARLTETLDRLEVPFWIRGL